MPKPLLKWLVETLLSVSTNYNHYKKYLLERYEGTYYPENAIDAGKAAYIKRNRDMIDNSDFCVVYYNENYAPHNRKSGTKTALDYAKRKNKKITLLP